MTVKLNPRTTERLSPIMTVKLSLRTRGVKQINKEEFKPTNDEELELNNDEKVKPYGEYVRHTPAWLEYLSYIIDYRVKPDNDGKVNPTQQWRKGQAQG